MKKSFILFLIFLLNFSLCFSQEINDETKNDLETTEKIEKTKTKNENSSKVPLTLFVNLGPQIQINTLPLPSAPSPVLFSAGMGLKINFIEYLSFSPHINVTGTYYLLQNGKALPSSPENRLGFVPEFLIDLPFCFVYPVKNSYFSLGCGLALFARIGWMASKVEGSEKENLKMMNKNFWQDANFIYPSFQFAWDFVLKDGTSFGLFAKYFMSVSNFKSEINPIQDTIILVGARANFPCKK